MAEQVANMVVGIHPDRIGSESYADKWQSFLEVNGLEWRTVDLLAPDALQQAEACQGIMWRWAHNPTDKQSAKRILFTIEKYLGIPVFPDFRTAWHYDEKVAQYYLFHSIAVPMPKTWLFWDYERAIIWSKNTSYPVVFKLSSGAGSANVFLVNSPTEALAYIDKIFTRGIFPYATNQQTDIFRFPRNMKQLKMMLRRGRAAWHYAFSNSYPPLPSAWWKPERDYAYFQEYLAGNEFDTRITIIGNRAFGFRRFNRDGDFRASGSGRIDHDPAAIDRRCIDLAFRISRDGKFQSMAYDFLYRNGEPVVSEISYAFADWAVYSCPGHWLDDMTWVEGQIWPEEAQVNDFVSLIRTGGKIPD